MTEADTTGATRPADGVWTVLRMIRWSGEYLEDKGVSGGRLDAEHLLAHVLDLSRLQLYLQYERPLTPVELAEYKPMLLRRAGREPLQYILGTAAFRNLEVAVDERVLIPRPETEQLVEAVLEWARKRDEATLTVLDVGTGSGCIALSLAQEGPFRRVVGTDPSVEALELARRNVERTGFSETVELRRGSLFEPVRGERFHVVVSNPPYIPAGDEGSLEPEVRDWEPGDALFAGTDGLDVVRAVVEGAPAALHGGGLLALEVGLGQAPAVADLVRETGRFGEPTVRRDLAQRPRMVLAERTTEA